jgi:hypothetical protein
MLPTKKQGMTIPEQRANREMGGVLLLDDKCSKPGLPATDVLDSKHPMARVPDANTLPHHEELPEFIEVDVTEDSVEDTARKLSGGAELGGVDSYTLKHWLLGFGKASRGLRRIRRRRLLHPQALARLGFGKSSRGLRSACAEIIEWLANALPPWAAYRALRGGRLCELENNPGVRPVGIGEIFTRLFPKTILGLTLGEPKTACCADQLCSGLEAGIEGAIHAGQLMWDQHSEEENWGFLPVDARNAFNKVNRTAMLWAVQHEGPSGCRFVFNSY